MPQKFPFTLYWYRSSNNFAKYIDNAVCKFYW